MPVYVYEIVREDGQPSERFEMRQSIHEPGLKVHPETGETVRRVIQPAFVAGSHSQTAIAKNLKDPKKLESLGFTKYEKQGDGTYQKTAGKGPDMIRR